MSTMRDVEYEHGFILEEANGLPQREGGTWVKVHYEHHRYIREGDYKEGDEYAGEDTDTNVSGAPDMLPFLIWSSLPGMTRAFSQTTNLSGTHRIFHQKRSIKRRPSHE
jgi:hypothetical protein